MKYDLSVCIPQYNRMKCLQELLDSIINQFDCPTPVEICISDDASTDDTPALIDEYQKKYPHIVYYRFSENVGLDQNMLKAVSLAHGEYCWLMGNDDKVEQGAAKLITQRFKEYKDIPVLNVNGWQYDNQLKERLYPSVKKTLKKTFLNKDQVFDNLKDILSIFGDSFGFLGDNIFKRSLWHDVVAHFDLRQFDKSLYIHLAVLLLILQRHPRLLYIHQQCMGFRGNNDGFLEILGQVRRLKLDVYGYDTVAEGIFSKKSNLYKIWMSRVIKVHIQSRVLAIKMNQAENSMRTVASLTYNHFGSLPAFWIYIFPLLLVPRPILLAFRTFYRATIKKMQQDK